MELGQHIDESVLEGIKQKTGGTRIQVGAGLENFEAFFKHLEELSLSRYFLHFVQEARRFKLPVIEGQVIIANPDHYLVPDQPFQMNGVSYNAQRPDHNQQHAPLVLDEGERKENSQQIQGQQYRGQLEQMRKEFEEAQQRQFAEFQAQLSQSQIQLQTLESDLQATRSALQQSQALQIQQAGALEQLRAENDRLRLALQQQPASNVDQAVNLAASGANDNLQHSQRHSVFGDEMGSMSSRASTIIAELSSGSDEGSSIRARELSSEQRPALTPALTVQRQQQSGQHPRVQGPGQDSAPKKDKNGSWCAIQ